MRWPGASLPPCAGIWRHERIVSAPARLSVALGARSYDIVVGAGLLAEAGALLAPLLARRRLFVVSDRSVARLHLGTLKDALAAADIACDAVILPPGERSKRFRRFEALATRLLDLGLERGDTIAALGGGVVGDLAGFAAGVLHRGTGFVQLPTTLLAQVDSSVGGKTGIDTRHGKNLVGVFHQPRLVLADTAVLATLPRRQLLAGYAEIVKYALLGDAAFFAWLEAHGPQVVAAAGPERRRAVLKSCTAKAAIVAADEREAGRRALLNLGHTFGHALEAAAGFGPGLLHGEAVAIGMAMAFALAAHLGLCPAGDARRATAHLAAMGLPVHPTGRALPTPDADLLLAHMARDKKVVDGRIALVLPRAIGDVFLTRQVAPDRLRAWLAHMLAHPPAAA